MIDYVIADNVYKTVVHSKMIEVDRIVVVKDGGAICMWAAICDHSSRGPLAILYTHDLGIRLSQMASTSYRAKSIWTELTMQDYVNPLIETFRGNPRYEFCEFKWEEHNGNP